MSHHPQHWLCLTLDTDPDGLSGIQTNRYALNFNGLEYVQAHLRETLHDVPITWFVRADGQLRTIFGRAAYLLEHYHDFWQHALMREDEIGWHPHLYNLPTPHAEPTLITIPAEACIELQRIWDELRALPYNFRCFRNGEGWHTPETYAFIESLGFQVDSTAIPGRDDSPDHPRNWADAPNMPYFPTVNNLRAVGPPRLMLEIPMNTWHIQAAYDTAPRLRYINPTVHPTIFQRGLSAWLDGVTLTPDPYVWVLICHPDEIAPSSETDALYARSPSALRENLMQLTAALEHRTQTYEWVTLSHAAEGWRSHHESKDKTSNVRP